MKHIPTQTITVSNEADLILLRQMLRQSSRTLGFSPAQQARVTAAISEILRALIHQFCTSDINIHCDDSGRTHALVIECDTERESYHRATNLPSVKAACHLIDEVKVEPSPFGYHIQFRIGIV
ncbi:hypothetical protein [Chloroflexus sp. Y-396-1]|uniref:hypothetical protein n=1 Tax=Chloroflexus sp. Y-396-1 TaxID=867845 RepID=UPI00048EAA9D|nr:hypothetical protein [Chloroflexus sp. Y-396-1]